MSMAICQSGYHMNSSGVCVPNTTTDVSTPPSVTLTQEAIAALQSNTAWANNLYNSLKYDYAQNSPALSYIPSALTASSSSIGSAPDYTWLIIGGIIIVAILLAKKR